MNPNGVFRVAALPDPGMPALDARALADKDSLLLALGKALDSPDYYGGNWDALEECLLDLSWRQGPLNLAIIHAEALPAEVRDTLIDICTAAAAVWAREGREFRLYLA